MHNFYTAYIFLKYYTQLNSIIALFCIPKIKWYCLNLSAAYVHIYLCVHNFSIFSFIFIENVSLVDSAVAHIVYWPQSSLEQTFFKCDHPNFDLNIIDLRSHSQVYQLLLLFCSILVLIQKACYIIYIWQIFFPYLVCC